jgi:hypothetical protein
LFRPVTQQGAFRLARHIFQKGAICNRALFLMVFRGQKPEKPPNKHEPVIFHIAAEITVRRRHFSAQFHIYK